MSGAAVDVSIAACLTEIAQANGLDTTRANDIANNLAAGPRWYGMGVPATRSSVGVTPVAETYAQGVLAFLKKELGGGRSGRKRTVVLDESKLKELLFPDGKNKSVRELNAYVSSQWRELRARLFELLLHGYLDQLLGEVDVQAANTYVARALHNSIADVVSLRSVHSDQRRVQVESRGAAGVVDLITAIDRELTYRSDSAARSGFDAARLTPGQSCVQLFEQLKGEGANLGHPTRTIIDKFIEVVNDAKDSRLNAQTRPCDQRQVEYLIRHYADQYRPILDMRELEDKLNNDEQARLPMLSRHVDRGDRVKRERGAYGAAEKPLDDAFDELDLADNPSTPTSTRTGEKEARSPLSTSAPALAAALRQMPLKELGARAMKDPGTPGALPVATEDNAAMVCAAYNRLQTEGSAQAKTRMIPGPLPLKRILEWVASNPTCIPELKGVVQCPVWNVDRTDGKWGLECTLCKAFRRTMYIEEASYNDFMAKYVNAGTGKVDPRSRAQCVVVHFQAHCRELRLAVQRAVEADPSLAWMAVPDQAGYRADLERAKAEHGVSGQRV